MNEQVELDLDEPEFDLSEMDESIMNTSYQAGTTVTNTDMPAVSTIDNGGFTDEANLYANKKNQINNKHLRMQVDKKERHIKLFQGISEDHP